MPYTSRAILFLPIVEWSFRRQRPQQLARCFARGGWRVYYPRLRLTAEPQPPQLVESGIWELSLAGDPDIDPYQQALSASDAATAVASLARLASSGHPLHGCWIVAQLPAWCELGVAVRDHFGASRDIPFRSRRTDRDPRHGSTPRCRFRNRRKARRKATRIRRTCETRIHVG